MKKSILIILVLVGILNATCTRDNAKEVVSCGDSGLMWQDDSNAKAIKKNWHGAIDYCESLDFAGYDDWRLPNYNELESIVDYKKPSGESIKDGFINTTKFYSYWSSTSYAFDSSNAWNIAFNGGSDVGKNNKSKSFFVRCVRTGQ